MTVTVQDVGSFSDLNPNEVRQKITDGETFVVNVVTDWCPDCTERQRPHLPAFIQTLKTVGIPVYQMTVQHERLQFLSEAHRSLTEEFGGHGYPRTVLVVKGKIQTDSKVEVITEIALKELASELIERVGE